MIPTRLPARLQCLADEIPKSNRLIDVGSDHGFISSYALEMNRVQSIIATDIHRSPAERTREYLVQQDFASRSEVYCRNGLSGILLENGDTVVIAGMGGLEMIQILSKALSEQKGKFPKNTVFLLQPQRSEEELRAFLSGNGFLISAEKICFDRGRTYVIIISRYTGRPYSITLEQKILGPCILESNPPGTARYLFEKIRSLEKQRLSRPELDRVIQFISERVLFEGGPANE